MTKRGKAGDPVQACARDLPPLGSEDVYEIASADDPQISPDGQTVAYVVRSVDRDANAYRAEVWLCSVDGAAPPRPLMVSGRHDISPRWSPDGRRLGFLSNRESEAHQLYVMDLASGSIRRLTNLPEGAQQPAWASAGDMLAFASRVPDAAYGLADGLRPARRITRLQYKLDGVGWTHDRRQHLFAVNADGSTPPTQLTCGDFEDWAPAWSPDGSRIAFVSARHENWDLDDTNDIYVVEVVGGQPELLTESDGRCDAPAWSPDGTRIAYRYQPGRLDFPYNWEIAVVDLQTGIHEILTSAIDWTCVRDPSMRAPLWDAEEILFPLEDRGAVHLYSVETSDASPPRLRVGGRILVTGYDTGSSGLVYSAMTSTSPSDLYLGDRRLTSVGGGVAEQRELIEPEHFRAVSSDGNEVDAWLIRPVGLIPARRYPLVLRIHGGPYLQYGYRFVEDFHVLSGAGYAVVYANPRGSSGTTQEWARGIKGPSSGGPGWGTLDYDDLMAVVDEALRRFNFLDEQRMGVYGYSYGGFMTSWIVGHTDRFAAACAGGGVYNWVSMHGSSDSGEQFKSWFGSFWFEDVGAHLRLSPLTYAENIRTPLLLLHAEHDLRAPLGQPEQLFNALRLLGRNVELACIPGESHGNADESGSPAHRVMKHELLLDWFDAHLHGEESGSL